MPTKYRPNLLRRLLAWRVRPPQHDPADMGTDIGLEYFLTQSAQPAALPRSPMPTKPWQGRPN